jgi:hypothetical protein
LIKFLSFLTFPIKNYAAFSGPENNGYQNLRRGEKWEDREKMVSRYMAAVG